MKRGSLILILLAVAAFGSSESARACMCRESSACEAYGESAAVFVGQALSESIVAVTEQTEKGPVEYQVIVYRFRVEEAFKGVAPGEVDLFAGTVNGSCNRGFTIGHVYLIYAGGEAGKRLTTSECNRARRLTDADADLDYLRGLGKAAPGGTLSGTITRYNGDREHGPSQRIGPMADTVVIVEGPGGRFETRTNAKGYYELTGLAPGEYDVRPVVSAGLGSITGNSLPDRNGTYSGGMAEVFDRGCTIQNVSVQPDGRISGTLIDAEGRPVVEARVEIVKAETFEDAGRLTHSFRAWTDESGRYEFRMVPAGRYYLGVQIVGAPNPELPYPRRFYPGEALREDAKTIFVSEGAQLVGIDLAMGPRPAEVELTGRVITSNGAPVADSLVMIRVDGYGEVFGVVERVTAGKDGTFRALVLDGVLYKVEALGPIEGVARGKDSKVERVTAAKQMKPITLVLPP